MHVNHDIATALTSELATHDQRNNIWNHCNKLNSHKIDRKYVEFKFMWPSVHIHFCYIYASQLNVNLTFPFIW